MIVNKALEKSKLSLVIQVNISWTLPVHNNKVCDKKESTTRRLEHLNLKYPLNKTHHPTIAQFHSTLKPLEKLLIL